MELKKVVLTEEQKRVQLWMLGRKVEAGAITARELDNLEKLSIACDVAGHAIEDIKKITELIAECTNSPHISRMLVEARGEKFDKTVLRDISAADGTAKSAMIYLLEIKNRLIDAEIKLKSTGWLSDRPPYYSADELLELEEVKRRAEATKAANSQMRNNRDTAASKHEVKATTTRHYQSPTADAAESASMSKKKLKPESEDNDDDEASTETSKDIAEMTEVGEVEHELRVINRKSSKLNRKMRERADATDTAADAKATQLEKDNKILEECDDRAANLRVRLAALGVSSDASDSSDVGETEASSGDENSEIDVQQSQDNEVSAEVPVKVDESEAEWQLVLRSQVEKAAEMVSENLEYHSGNLLRDRDRMLQAMYSHLCTAMRKTQERADITNSQKDFIIDANAQVLKLLKAARKNVGKQLKLCESVTDENKELIDLSSSKLRKLLSKAVGDLKSLRNSVSQRTKNKNLTEAKAARLEKDQKLLPTLVANHAILDTIVDARRSVTNPANKSVYQWFSQDVLAVEVSVDDEALPIDLEPSTGSDRKVDMEPEIKPQLIDGMAEMRAVELADDELQEEKRLVREAKKQAAVTVQPSLRDAAAELEKIEPTSAGLKAAQLRPQLRPPQQKPLKDVVVEEHFKNRSW